MLLFDFRVRHAVQQRRHKAGFGRWEAACILLLLDDEDLNVASIAQMRTVKLTVNVIIDGECDSACRAGLT